MFAILHIPSGTFLSSMSGTILTPLIDAEDILYKQLDTFIYNRGGSLLWLPEQMKGLLDGCNEEMYGINEFEIVEVN